MRTPDTINITITTEWLPIRLTATRESVIDQNGLNVVWEKATGYSAGTERIYGVGAALTRCLVALKRSMSLSIRMGSLANDRSWVYRA